MTYEVLQKELKGLKPDDYRNGFLKSSLNPDGSLTVLIPLNELNEVNDNE